MTSALCLVQKYKHNSISIYQKKTITKSITDKPWVTEGHNDLIPGRQMAHNNKDTFLFKQQRNKNKINRIGKTLLPKNYHTKVQHLKPARPDQHGGTRPTCNGYPASTTTSLIKNVQINKIALGHLGLSVAAQL